MSESRKPTIAEAIYRDTKIIKQTLQTLTTTTDETENPNERNPIDMLLSIQEATLESIRQLQSGQEQILSLLSQPTIAKAVEDMLKN